MWQEPVLMLSPQGMWKQSEETYIARVLSCKTQDAGMHLRSHSKKNLGSPLED